MKKMLLIFCLSIMLIPIHFVCSDSDNEQSLHNLLQDAAENGWISQVQTLMQDPRFDKINVEKFGQAFIKAVKHGHEKIVEMLIKNPKFLEILDFYLQWALMNAAANGHENIIKILLMNNPRVSEFSSEHLEKGLKEAMKYGYRGSANWLKAFTALKPADELRDIGYTSNLFINAYQEFLGGNPNDLRNLISVSRIKLKDGNSIYFSALMPYKLEETLTPVYKKIAESLFTIFKKDHIKPLILALVDSNYELKAALDLLQYMGLITESEFIKSLETIEKDKKRLQEIPTAASAAAATHAWPSRKSLIEIDRNKNSLFKEGMESFNKDYDQQLQQQSKNLSTAASSAAAAAASAK